MKLLLDENLSKRIIPLIEGSYPGSTQVTLINLERASDVEIWRYASENDFIIVTKDADFYELSLQHHNNAPKIIWLKLPNSSTDDVMKLLISKVDEINDEFYVKNKVCIKLGGTLILKPN